MGASAGSLKGDGKEFKIYSFSEDIDFSFVASIESFTDNFTVNVNSEQVYGRIDPIKTYTGTTREISFSLLFTDASGDDWINIQTMAACVYPRYQKPNSLAPYTLKSPPLFAIYLEDLLYSKNSLTIDGYEDEDGNNVAAQTLSNYLPGYFTSFGISYDTDDGTQIVGGRSAVAKQIPKSITLNFSFSPLHDKMGGYDQDGIALTTGWPFPE